MRQCLARRDRSSPAGQIQCMGEAQQQWQAVMDGAYQRLLKDAPADAKRGWQDSQRHWLTWRKDEVHLLKAVYDTTRGTSYAMSSADLQLQPVRDRALALRGAADRYAPAPAAVPVAATSGAQGSAGDAPSAAGAGQTERQAGERAARSGRAPRATVRTGRRVRACAVRPEPLLPEAAPQDARAFGRDARARAARGSGSAMRRHRSSARTAAST